MNPPPDCTCTGEVRDYGHTQGAGPEISQSDLRIMAEMETCPAEKRALLRIAADVGRKP